MSWSIELLSELLRDGAVEMRRQAVGELATIGGEEARALLVSALVDEDDAVRKAAGAALRALSPDPPGVASVDHLLGMYGFEFAETVAEKYRQEIARHFANVSDAGLVPDVVRGLIWRVQRGSEHGATLLGSMGPLAAGAVEALAALAGDEKMGQPAMGALKRIGRDAQPAVPSVLAQLRSEKPWVREAAARALGAITAEPSDEIFRALLDALGDEGEVQRAASSALGSLPLPHDAREVIVELLRRGKTRPGALALEACADRIQDPIPLFASLLDDPNASFTAANALACRASDPAALEPLLAACRAGNQTAVGVLGYCKPPPPAAVHLACEIVRDAAHPGRSEAASVLKIYFDSHVAPADRDALELAIDLKREDWTGTREDATSPDGIWAAVIQTGRDRTSYREIEIEYEVVVWERARRKVFATFHYTYFESAHSKSDTTPTKLRFAESGRRLFIELADGRTDEKTF
jgi:HEAT repeat protein